MKNPFKLLKEQNSDIFSYEQKFVIWIFVTMLTYLT